MGRVLSRRTCFQTLGIAAVSLLVSCISTIHAQQLLKQPFGPDPAEPLPVQLNPSVLILGRWDYIPYQAAPPFTSRCTDMIDRIIERAGGTSIVFVPTVYWTSDDTEKRSTVSGYCYMDGMDGVSKCKPVTPESIDEFRQGLQLCMEMATERGFNEIAIVPHLDDATRVEAAWRNAIEFAPLQNYGGWTYEQVLLNPIADAMGAAAKQWTVIDFALQGEMSATVTMYPHQWLRIAQRMRQRMTTAANATTGTQLWDDHIKIGLSWNYNKIQTGGLAPPKNATGDSLESKVGNGMPYIPPGEALLPGHVLVNVTAVLESRVKANGTRVKRARARSPATASVAGGAAAPVAPTDATALTMTEPAVIVDPATGATATTAGSLPSVAPVVAVNPTSLPTGNMAVPGASGRAGIAPPGSTAAATASAPTSSSADLPGKVPQSSLKPVALTTETPATATATAAGAVTPPRTTRTPAAASASTPAPTKPSVSVAELPGLSDRSKTATTTPSVSVPLIPTTPSPALTRPSVSRAVLPLEATIKKSPSLYSSTFSSVASTARPTTSRASTTSATKQANAATSRTAAGGASAPSLPLLPEGDDDASGVVDDGDGEQLVRSQSGRDSNSNTNNNRRRRLLSAYEAAHGTALDVLAASAAVKTSEADMAYHRANQYAAGSGPNDDNGGTGSTRRRQLLVDTPRLDPVVSTATSKIRVTRRKPVVSASTAGVQPLPIVDTSVPGSEATLARLPPGTAEDYPVLDPTPGTGGPTGLLDVASLEKLLRYCQFIGISAYASINTVDFDTNELQNSVFTFFKEFYNATRIDLEGIMKEQRMELHYSEMGLGGGVSGNGTAPATEAIDAARNPFYGVYPKSYDPDLDPWRTPVVRTFMMSFWRKTMKWLSTGGGLSYFPVRVFMWTKGSYDILGIYPESTSPAGTFYTPAISQAVKQHNTAAAAAWEVYLEKREAKRRLAEPVIERASAWEAAAAAAAVAAATPAAMPIQAAAAPAAVVPAADVATGATPAPAQQPIAPGAAAAASVAAVAPIGALAAPVQPVVVAADVKPAATAVPL